MILNIITLIFIIIKSTRCSNVHDAANQNTIYVSNYCPTQKYCREGTHVMCMYYGHGQEFGPHCDDPIKTEITPTMVQKILENVNNVRGRLASGIEKGKDDEDLPRAYGMMKMEWDRELATFAQVLANQCLGGTEDICRATEYIILRDVILSEHYASSTINLISQFKSLEGIISPQINYGPIFTHCLNIPDNFPNPSQSIAIIHYKYPNWDSLRRNDTDKSGLTEEKRTFAVEKFINSAHALKRTMTKEMIVECPPINELPDMNLKYYMNLIRGGATHIGCGMSAYTKYKSDGDTESTQNHDRRSPSTCRVTVCNISDGPQPTQPLYNTNPPIPGLGFTKRCGCPRGYQESQNCLCEKEMDYPWTNIVTTAAATSPTYYNIQPTFQTKKLKDPILKLPSSRPLIGQTELQHKPQPEYFITDSSNSVEKQTDNDEGNCQVKFMVQPVLSIKDAHSEELTTSRNYWNEPPGGPSRNRNIIVWKGKNSGESQSREKKVDQISYSDETYKEISKAIRPKRKHKHLKCIYDRNIPAKKLSSKLKKFRPKNHKHVFKPATTAAVEDLFNAAEEVTTESALNIAEENFVNNYQNSNQKKYVLNVETYNEKNEDNENKRLISILRILEKEVKNIEFDDNLKQVFDSKMRNIYETAIKKPQEISPSVPAKQLDNMGLKEIKHYLENKYNTDIVDEVNILRRESDRLLKNNRPTYVENEINHNQNYEYVDRQLDEIVEPKYINNMDNPYEDILSDTDLNSKKLNQKLWLSERQASNIKHNDILNNKYNIDRQYDGNDNSQNNYETRYQETIASDNKNVAQKAIDYQKTYKYDEKKNVLDVLRDIDEILNARKFAERNYKRILINGKDRRLDMNKVNKSTGRRIIKFPEIRPQYSRTSRINKNGELRPIRMLRPKVQNIPQIIEADDLKNKPIRSKKPPQEQVMYLSDSEIFNN